MSQTPSPGQMFLYDAAIPPLSDGQHTITVTTAMTGGPSGATIADASFSVEVAGPQFALPAGEVISVTPTTAATGVDPNVLAQVVLARHTLPWERSFDSTPGQSPTPWLALILVDDDELPAGAVTRGAQVASLPDAALQGATSTSGVCDTLQLPAALVATVLPAPGDLPLLCHVRQVNTADRELGIGGDDGCFAVVTANRLPTSATATLTHAFLISVENRIDVLLAGATGSSQERPATLVLLTDWTFTTGFDLSFGYLINGVATNAAALAHSPANPVMLAYTDRDGAQQPARYHGPLSGDASATSAVGGAVDVSLQAAGQLGRLLASADRTQVKAISDWQRADLLSPATTAGQSQTSGPAGSSTPTAVPMTQRLQSGAAAVAAALPALSTPPASRWTPATSVVRPTAGSSRRPTSANTRLRGSAAGALTPTASRAARVLHARIALAQASPDPSATDAVPETVLQALCRYYLLEGLPLAYALPDQGLLPDASIRFFNLDRDWNDALAAGVLAVSAAGSSGQAFVARHLAQAMGDVRARLATGTVQPVPTSTNNSGTNDDPPPITGFLLRSSVVSAYPQLEVRAFAADSSGKPPAADADPADPAVAALQLPTLRLATITASVLIALFSGQPAAIWIDEPHHGLRVGVEPPDAQHPEPYVASPSGADFVVPFRGAGQRVIDMAALADAASVGPGGLAGLLLRLPVREVFTAASQTLGGS